MSKSHNILLRYEIWIVLDLHTATLILFDKSMFSVSNVFVLFYLVVKITAFARISNLARNFKLNHRFDSSNKK